MKTKWFILSAAFLSLMLTMAVSCSKDDTYESLPTFNYDGKTYKVAPSTSILTDFNTAYGYCEQYSIDGVRDWRLPTCDEMVQMYNQKKKIGGFMEDGNGYWCMYETYEYVDENDYEKITNAAEVIFSGIDAGRVIDRGNYGGDYENYVRPVRVEENLDF